MKTLSPYGVSFYTIKNEFAGAEDCFFPGGTKYCEQVKNHSKMAYSVMFCCNAAGDMLPPMVVYKSDTTSVYALWMEGGPDGTTYAASKNGWVDMKKFRQWFRKGRVCCVNGTVLLCYRTFVP